MAAQNRYQLFDLAVAERKRGRFAVPFAVDQVKLVHEFDEMPCAVGLQERHLARQNEIRIIECQITVKLFGIGNHLLFCGK